MFAPSTSKGAGKSKANRDRKSTNLEQTQQLRGTHWCSRQEGKVAAEAQERDVSQDVYLVAIKLIPFSVNITDDMLCSMFKWKFNDHYLQIIDQVVELLITEDEKGSAVILFKIFQWS